MPETVVTRTYLRMAEPAQLRPRAAPPLGARVDRVERCTPAQYRALYGEVGRAWHWHDRDAWSDDRLAEHLAEPGVGIWVARVGDDVVGYFELQRHDDGDVELVYFGLVERFIGRGLGGWLLTVATEQAWQLGATSVWLHTCTLDHPAALANYRARGFTPYRTETYETSLP